MEVFCKFSCLACQTQTDTAHPPDTSQLCVARRTSHEVAGKEPSCPSTPACFQPAGDAIRNYVGKQISEKLAKDIDKG